MASDSFTCPACGRTSHRPTDVAEGYCGACHDWTGAVPRPASSTRSCRRERRSCPRAAREQHGDPHRDVCPQCAAGKHDNCDGHPWCDSIDVGVDCTCALEDHRPV